jgi:GT2 family glycosyltransferase
MTQKNPIVILGVIYNTYLETIRFIESIKCCFDNEVKLILVDNSDIPPDSFFTEKIHNSDFITYIKTEKNVGYFHGAKLGLMHFMENNHYYPQWTIVCNVDIIFETTLLSKKLGSYENIPDLGLIAPAIISNQWKTDFNPFHMSRISLKKLYFYQMIYSNILFHNGYILIHHFKKFMKMFFLMISAHRKSEINTTREIYAPHGSCIIFNKNYFERGGTLNHISFLFGEEIFVGETASGFGLKVLYVPEFKVRHYEHSSIGNFISHKINEFYKQSIEDIIKYYYQ